MTVWLDCISIEISLLASGSSGALGPAGGTLVRGLLVGKGAASAARAATLPNGKTLVAVTDTTADLLLQPTAAAVAAELNGGNGQVAAGSAVGGGLTGEILTQDLSSDAQTTKGGIRGAAVAVGRRAAAELIKGTLSKGAGDATQKRFDEPDE